MTSTEKSISNLRGGFTLVELLLVITILAVLAGVAIHNLGGISEEARVTATRTSIGSIESAAKTYEIRTGKYPDSMDVLMQPMGERPALLDDKAKADAWGTPFQLRRADGAKGIEIRSAGPDGQMNTGDDVTN